MYPYGFPQPGSAAPMMDYSQPMQQMAPLGTYMPPPIVLAPAPQPVTYSEPTKPFPSIPVSVSYPPDGRTAASGTSESLDPCCTLPWSLVTGLFFTLGLFVLYVTVGTYLGFGDYWNYPSKKFCNGYWWPSSIQEVILLPNSPAPPFLRCRILFRISVDAVARTFDQLMAVRGGLRVATAIGSRG